MVIYTDYITPSRTLETISSEGSNEYLYIYNYEGIHYRLFIGLLELTEFFESGTEPKYDFTDEGDLDLFLGEYLKDINSF
ncbi:hypothetical protein [Aequorivita antarctica]|uniref:Uncharacterized protein n=1 Tax=Aequorivita antarctica TaxID=153266 RepID=A0A5C6Z0I5_9FLAO|nr:hypothetical protein [Aequorivita antarctica]TXD72868.1 hypothetical protein ESU54_09440 [Aequorivita antarctica]SRX76255.1 hypothetical protein AEQU3_03254 [Aequorivita antarctica]